MKGIKLIPIILALLLFLSSCGIIIINNGEEEETIAPETTPEELQTYIPPDYPSIPTDDREKAAAERVEALPDADLGGLAVIIAAENEGGGFFSDETGVYVDAVRRRNSMVSDKYNTSIVTVYKNAVDIHTDIRNAKNSGDYFADFCAVSGSYLGAYNAAGFILNLEVLPYTDFTRDCYNQQAMGQLSVGGILYGAVGALTETPDQLGCMYINKELLSSLGGKLDYGQIYDGELTWDVFFEYLSLCDDAHAAFVTSADNGTVGLYSYMGAGKTFLSPSNGSLYADFVNDSTRTVIGTVKKLISLKTGSVDHTVTELNEAGETVEKTVKLSGFNIFVNGYALSALGTLGEMSALENAGFSWEVLPFPKHEGQEDYYSSTGTNSPVITFLASSPNIDYCGYVLQAMSEASYGYVQNAFVVNAMKSYITGVYTPDMIDLVLENPVYDFCYMFGNTHAAVKNGTYSVYLNAITSNKDIGQLFTAKLSNELEKVLSSYR